MTDAQVEQKPKRVVWITGGKGGTGKSTFARGLLDTLLTAKIGVAALDGDHDNAQLFRHYKSTDVGVTRIGIKERDGVDKVITEMEEVGTDVILIDVPAGGGQLLLGLEEEIGFLSAMAEIGYQLTMVTVLSRIKDSVNQLKLAMDITEGFGVRHVAVRNLYYGEANKFRFLDRSKTKQRLEANGGVVIDMRDLYEDTYERIDDLDLPFFRAVDNDSPLSRPDARRVKQWLTHMEQQVKFYWGAARAMSQEQNSGIEIVIAKGRLLISYSGISQLSSSFRCFSLAGS